MSVFHHFFRRPLHDDVSAVDTGLWTEIDDPVGRLNDIEIVFDDDNRVPLLDEAGEHLQQFGDVVDVQAGRGFIQQIERASGVGTGEFGGQLHPLRFTTAQGCGGLTEREVIESDGGERCQRGESSECSRRVREPVQLTD